MAKMKAIGALKALETSDEQFLTDRSHTGQANADRPSGFSCSQRRIGQSGRHENAADSHR